MSTVHPKKHLGQHFLKDNSLAERIVSLLEGAEDQPVVEIGPGRGILTQFLLEKYPKLWLVEVDPEAAAFIEQAFKAYSPQVHLRDILKWEMAGEIPHDTYFIGNLPYNISSPIFFRLLEHLPYIKKGVFMVQKEVADRICSPPGNKTYGILSVLLGAYFDCSYAFTVGPGAFIPPPKVKSAVMVLERKAILPEVPFPHLKQVVKSAFNQRRKTLRNAVKGLHFSEFEGKSALMSQRAEQLSVEQFIYLTQQFSPID